MENSAPSVSYPETRLTSVTRVEFAPAQDAQPPANLPNQTQKMIDAQREQITPGKLLVRIDVEAGRFIQTLTDSSTMEMVWRYPSEGQLAFSRAIKAYMKAIVGQARVVNKA
ncbi:hypothetical protein U91I_03930 [alpha proteobacterium U9-1i]|nr:hypothetical protein U91I_03930 [alpha proteobacterium U9-1i]